MGDVLSDAVMFFPLVKLPGVTPGWVLLFIFLALLNEFIGVLTKAATGVRRYDGPMGKSDRAVVLGLTCLLFFFFPAVKVSFDYIFAGMSLLLVASSAAPNKEWIGSYGKSTMNLAMIQPEIALVIGLIFGLLAFATLLFWILG